MVSSTQRIEDKNIFSIAASSESDAFSGSVSMVIGSVPPAARATRNSIKPSYPSLRASLVTEGTLTFDARAISLITISEACLGSFSMKSATLRSADGRDEYAERIFIKAGMAIPPIVFFLLNIINDSANICNLKFAIILFVRLFFVK